MLSSKTTFVTMRMPEDLKRALQHKAVNDGRSLSNQIIVLLYEALKNGK